MKSNRLLYPLIEKELSALFSMQRIEQLYSYRSECEHSFARYIGAEFCSLIDSGTTGLYLACALAGIGKDDEVILPILSWPSAVAAVVSRGAIPHFVDIKEDCTIDVQKVAHSITGKTKCIIPVHMYGHAAEMDALLDLAKEKKLKLIEDCCQAHGTRIAGKMVGLLGDFGVFSFDPFKTISTVGTGGAIVYSEKEHKERIHAMLSIEKADQLVLELHRTPGKMSFTDMAVLKVKLKAAAFIEKKKKACTERYEELLQKTPLTIIKDKSSVCSIRQSYLVYAPKRDELMQFLNKFGIICKEAYTPIHSIPLYSKYITGLNFPNAERYAKEAIILPLFAFMEPKDVDIVCQKIMGFYSGS